jgi:uncharacterized protein YbjT (DUF2867 family)
MKIFVAGATGLTGRFVVEALREKGVEVSAHVRPDSQRLGQWSEHFEALGATVDSTPWTAEAMAARFEENPPDFVFSLLGTTKKRHKTRGDGDYMAVDFGLTAMLIDALAKQPQTRFVYLSSLGTKEGVRSAYMKARWHTEEHLRQSGLPHLIARPSFILGERDEPRLGERIGGGISNVVLGTVGLLGGRRFADRVGSIQGKALGYGLVREALEWPADNRVVFSNDLR